MDAAEIQKQLDDLEPKAEELRHRYEQYFMGIERLEPLVLRRDVERRIKALRREQVRNTAQRFKFNTLVQRFNLMQQHWARVVREIENGTYKRDVMRAAARFGANAVGPQGKKRLGKDLAAIAESPVSSADSYELGADDLIEVEEELDAPTPPRLALGNAVGVPQPPAAPAPPPAGLRLGGLAGLRAPVAMGNPVVGVPQPPPVTSPATDVKRKVAELAAQLSARRTAAAAQPAAPQAAGFGEIDLALGAQDPAVPPASPPKAAGAPLPPRPAPKPAPGFGEIDIPLGLDPVPAPAARPAPGPARVVPPVAPRVAAPSAPARPVAPVPQAPSPKPIAAPAAPAAPRASDGLADSRIKQIYAQYVETKRSTHESTASVTYEKLAASLRAQADKLRASHPNRSVDYEVVVKDGKTHLKPVLR